MTTPADIFTAICGMLKEKYGFKTYGHEVTEGYSKPSFFVDIRPVKSSNTSVFYKEYAYSIAITYFPVKNDEIDNLTKAMELQNLFGYNITLKSGTIINISDYDYEFIGEKTDILQFSMDTEFCEKNAIPDTHEIAAEINLNSELKGV